MDGCSEGEYFHSKELGKTKENGVSSGNFEVGEELSAIGTSLNLLEITPNYASTESESENEDVKSDSRSNPTRRRVFASSQVANFTLEAMYFLEELSKFQTRWNRIDSDLSDVLYQVIESISTFLDGDPHPIPETDKSIMCLNFERNTIKKQYFCDICQETTTNSLKALGKHINSEKHQMGMKVVKDGDGGEIASLKKQRRLETIIEKNPHIIAKILKRRERQEKEKAVQIQNLPKKIKMFILGDFSDFLQKAVTQAENMKSKAVVDDIAHQLQDALLARFPKMKIYFFGSRVNGLANEHSDLNIFIETDLLPPQCESATCVLEVANLIKYLLKEKKNTWKCCVLNESDKQLSLSARNIKYNIRCDIWVTRFITYFETLLIRHFIENLPIFQSVYLFIQYWMRETGLSEHFSSYVTTWLLVFSFQAQRLLPPISYLQTTCAPIVFGVWNVNFSKIPLTQFGINLTSKDYDTICYMIRKFFQLYSTFDFEGFVICPYLGYPIERNSFSNACGLLPWYSAFIARNPTQILPMKSSICLQNPLEQNLNIADNISKGSLKLFKQYCSQSLNILSNKNKPS